MSKRPKPSEPRELVPDRKQPEPVNPVPIHGANAPSLQHLRDGALERYSQTTETIAHLEAWRYEIDATIAFLRAQRNKPTDQKE